MLKINIVAPNDITPPFVRAIEPQDAEAVAVLIGQLGYNRSLLAVLEWIEHLPSASDRQAAFVACQNDEILGWIEVSLEHRLQSAPFAIIGGLVVKEAHRARGVGRLLCEQAEAWSWQHGVETLRVTSRSTRPDAHRFYLRDGYRAVKTSLVFEKSRPDPAP